MAMTVGQLKDLLEGYEDDMEVRIASQPNWPFEYGIRGVVSRSEVDEEDPDEEEDEERDPSAPEDCLFIVEGRQLCYGNKNIWNCV